MRKHKPYIAATLLLAATSVSHANIITTEHSDTIYRTRSMADLMLDWEKANNFSDEFDLKSNLLYDAVGTMSLGGEVKLSPRSSLHVMGTWNPWTFSDRTMYKSWSVMPEARWWPSQAGEYNDPSGRANSALQGHFLGVHILGGEFNFSRIRLPFNRFPGLKGHRFEGWFLGGGISYGYRYNISRRFALEASLGVGVLHTSYDKYKCGNCGERVGKGSRVVVGPTHASLNLIVRIGRNPRINPSARHMAMLHNTQDMVITRTLESIRTDTVYIHTREELHDTIDKNMSVKHADFTMHLLYPLNSSEINPSLGDNRRQLQMLRDFISDYASNPAIRIRSIVIGGYASVEGDASRNMQLSHNRAEAAAILVRDEYPALASLVEAKGYGEDWNSLVFDGKDDIMQIANPDMRERRLRELQGGRIFSNLMQTQLPQTRRIECIINFTSVVLE